MRNPRNDLPPRKLSGSSEQAEARRTRSSRSRAASRDPGHVAERSCILSRRSGRRDQLIRLALGLDGAVAPDVGARAPGRGAWIWVDQATLDAANSSGKLKAALARAFKTGELRVPADLGERIAAALRQAALDRLGLEARGGTLLSGADRIESAARSGQVHLLIHAADAGDDGRRRLDAALRTGADRAGPAAFEDPPAGLIFPQGRTILSMALGRENVVHVALIDPAAAARVQRALVRWQAFNDPSAGLSGPSAAARRPAAEATDTNAVDGSATNEGLE